MSKDPRLRDWQVSEDDLASIDAADEYRTDQKFDDLAILIHSVLLDCFRRGQIRYMPSGQVIEAIATAISKLMDEGAALKTMLAEIAIAASSGLKSEHLDVALSVLKDIERISRTHGQTRKQNEKT